MQMKLFLLAPLLLGVFSAPASHDARDLKSVENAIARVADGLEKLTSTVLGLERPTNIAQQQENVEKQGQDVVRLLGGGLATINKSSPIENAGDLSSVIRDFERQFKSSSNAWLRLRGTISQMGGKEIVLSVLTGQQKALLDFGNGLLAKLKPASSGTVRTSLANSWTSLDQALQEYKK